MFAIIICVLIFIYLIGSLIWLGRIFELVMRFVLSIVFVLKVLPLSRSCRIALVLLVLIHSFVISIMHFSILTLTWITHPISLLFILSIWGLNIRCRFSMIFSGMHSLTKVLIALLILIIILAILMTLILIILIKRIIACIYNLRLLPFMPALGMFLLGTFTNFICLHGCNSRALLNHKWNGWIKLFIIIAG